jgi:hypothetical protein
MSVWDAAYLGLVVGFVVALISYWMGRVSMQAQVLRTLEDTCSDVCPGCGRPSKALKYILEIQA